jgi:hypothetical protein
VNTGTKEHWLRETSDALRKQIDALNFAIQESFEIAPELTSRLREARRFVTQAQSAAFDLAEQITVDRDQREQLLRDAGFAQLRTREEARRES